MKVEVLDRKDGALLKTMTIAEAADRIRQWDFAEPGWHEAQLMSGREFASIGCVYRPVADEADIIAAIDLGKTAEQHLR